MPSFWREITEVVVNHTIGRRLDNLGDKVDMQHDRIRELEYSMTSAQSDIEALNALYTELDQWSNDIASELDSLREHAETGNVSAADVAARLAPIAARLKAAYQGGAPTTDTDPTTTTDPSNSPVATDPSVVPAEDAPTEAPTPDPVINPVDIPADSQAGSSANDAEAQGTVGTPDPATSVAPDNSASVADPTVAPANTDPTPSTTPATSSDSANTNDYKEEY